MAWGIRMNRRLLFAILLLLAAAGSSDASRMLGGGAPPPGCTITGVSHSGATTFTGNPNGDASGTAVGTFSATTSGSCASPSWTVSDSTDFQTSGATLETNGTPPPGNYSTTYTATIAGATGSPFTSGSSLAVTGNGFTGNTLSGTTFAPGASSGTVVGAIGVNEIGGTCGVGCVLSLTGTDAASFQLSSATLPSNLETQGVLCGSPPCSYSINVVATQSGIGANPKSTAFSITSNATANLTVALNFTNGLDSTGSATTLNFSQSSATNLGDYVGPYVCQHNYRQISTDGFWVVYFRPDCSGGRVEVVVELGSQLLAQHDTSTPFQQDDQFTATIMSGATTLATQLVDHQYWGTRWRWQSAARPLVRTLTGGGATDVAHTMKLMIPFDNSMLYGMSSAYPGAAYQNTPTPLIYSGPGDGAGIAYYMPDGGSRADIGLLPDMCAAWVANPTDVLAQPSCMAWGEATSSMQIHFRDLGAHSFANNGSFINTEIVSPSDWAFNTGWLQYGPDRTYIKAPCNPAASWWTAHPPACTLDGTETGSAPAAPTVTLTTGGLANNQINNGPFATQVNTSVAILYPGGMTSPASEDAVISLTPTNNRVVVHSPSDPGGGALGYRVYLMIYPSPGTRSTQIYNGNTLGNTVPIPFGTNYTQGVTGTPSMFTDDICHWPLTAYLPFLMTDDPFLLEEVQASADFAIWADNTSRPLFNAAFGTTLQGIVNGYHQSERCSAWAIRNIMVARMAMSTYSGTPPAWLLPLSYWDQVVSDNLVVVNKFVSSTSLAFGGLLKAYNALGPNSSWWHAYVLSTLGLAKWSGQFSGWESFYQYMLTSLSQYSDPNVLGWCNQLPAWIDGPYTSTFGPAGVHYIWENYSGQFDSTTYTSLAALYNGWYSTWGSTGYTGPPPVDYNLNPIPTLAACNRTGPLIKELTNQGADYFLENQFVFHLAHLNGETIADSAMTYVDAKMPALMNLYLGEPFGRSWKWSISP